MARVLLIAPPIYKEEYAARGSSHTLSILPPLGLAYIAAYLRKHDHYCEILDGMAVPYGIDDIVKKASGFDVVGITAVSTVALRVNQLLKAFKDNSIKAPVIVGGPHATVLPESCLRHGADYVVLGEGEITMLELVNALEAGKNTDGIEGIAFMREGVMIRNKRGEMAENLDEIPMPARDLLPMERYRCSIARTKKLPSHSILTSRGCPGTCSFCNKSISGTRVRYFSVGRIVEEFFLLRDRYGAEDVAVMDDNFVSEPHVVHSVCDELIRRKFGKTWSVEARIDAVDEDVLKHLKAAGCDFIAYGIESGTQKMLDRMKKRITLDQIRSVIKMTKDVGINIRGYFMMGMPGETLDDMEQTISFAKELDIDVASFSLFVPFPGTLDYRRALESGTFTDPEYFLHKIYPEFNFPDSPIYIPEGMTAEELLSKHRSAYNRYYFRPKFLLRTLLTIRSAGDIRRYTSGMLNLLGNFFSRKYRQ